MNGVHDLGGMHGFGPVERDPGPPTLERWEAAMIAIQSAGENAHLFNIDEFRHGIERMDPVHYLRSPYFEHWLDGIARILAESGFIDPEELERRAQAFLTGEEVVADSPAGRYPSPGGFSARRDIDALPRFGRGDPVLTRRDQPAGHTRLASYARGRRGVIHIHRGAYVFPDTHAHGLGEQPQHLYSVRFEPAELWGGSAEQGTPVFIDLWEPYLVPTAGGV